MIKYQEKENLNQRRGLCCKGEVKGRKKRGHQAANRRVGALCEHHLDSIMSSDIEATLPLTSTTFFPITLSPFSSITSQPPLILVKPVARAGINLAHSCTISPRYLGSQIYGQLMQCRDPI